MLDINHINFEFRMGDKKRLPKTDFRSVGLNNNLPFSGTIKPPEVDSSASSVSVALSISETPES